MIEYYPLLQFRCLGFSNYVILLFLRQTYFVLFHENICHYCISSDVSSSFLSIAIGSEISSNTVGSLSKFIDFTDLSGNWLCHALLYFPVDFPDRDTSFSMFHWFVYFDINRTFMFFLSWISFFLVIVDDDSIGWDIIFPLNYLACSFLYYFVCLDCLVLHHYLHQKF